MRKEKSSSKGRELFKQRQNIQKNKVRIRRSIQFMGNITAVSFLHDRET